MLDDLDELSTIYSRLMGRENESPMHTQTLNLLEELIHTEVVKLHHIAFPSENENQEAE